MKKRNHAKRSSITHAGREEVWFKKTGKSVDEIDHIGPYTGQGRDADSKKPPDLTGFVI